jgi:integrase
MPKLYTRNQGGKTRYYADLRDIGGGQAALRPPGSTRATEDKAEAAQLLANKIREMGGVRLGRTMGLGDFVTEFLAVNPGHVTERWLAETKLRLGRAVEFFGTDRELTTIRPIHLRQWLGKLSHLSASNQRHHLYALSSLYRYAQEVEVVPLGYNPVAGLYRKPSVVKQQQRTDEFFEVQDAARFLDDARRLDAYYEVIATYLLTGGRRTEVFGLLVGDIDFEVGTVRFKPNRYRGLKRVWSERTIPLWPQLREILEPYVETLGAEEDELLFPGRRDGMITDLRKPLREITKEAGMTEVPRITKFRHTYATARLQTTDNGKQISLWTVAKELGHKTVARVEDTYGHPSHYRVRGEVVEYRLPTD